MNEPHVTLFSADLLSKWGFNDGDDPEPWLDWCEAHGVDHNEIDYPLVALVRRYLLPVIEQAVTVVEIDTIHNPVRVQTINGEDVSDYWRWSGGHQYLLTPEYVDIPMSEVLKLAKELV